MANQQKTGKTSNKGSAPAKASSFGEYRMAGDFGSEKNMRNGKYAFPQLRNFHRLRDLKGETLFDNFMSVLSANHKHLWANYKNRGVRERLRGISRNLMRADRFVITSDLQRMIADTSFEASNEKIFDIFNNAIPPFDNMWIETERNPHQFTIEGGGDGYYEQIAWHIQRGGAYQKSQHSSNDEEIAALEKVHGKSRDELTRKETRQYALDKVSDNIIVITKYIKFSKAHDNPDKLFQDASIDFKMDKLPHDGGGCYYISNLSILVSDRPIPRDYTSALYGHALQHRKDLAPMWDGTGVSGLDAADVYAPILSFGKEWAERLTNKEQPHIVNNIARRVSVTDSYAMDLSHSLLYGAHFNTKTHAVDNKRVTDLCFASFGHYEDDLRILAWALSDFNYNWIFKKPATKPTRRNRSKPFRQATIETRTLEIELPKPRGKEMDEHQFGDGTPRKWHKVRGHWRVYKKTGYRVWIEPHERGDKTLGEVHKDYKLKLKKGEK